MNVKLIAFFIGAGAIASPALAQAPGVPFDPDQPVVQTRPAAKGKSQPAGQAKAAAKPAPAEGAAPSDATPQLRARVDQLEEQIVDIQVTMGTLESLGRGGGAAAAAAAARPSVGGGVDGNRIDALETQIRALTQQVEQLSQQLREQRGNTNGSLSQSSGTGFPSRPAAVPGGFGNTTVKKGDDEIGELIDDNPAGNPRGRAAGTAPMVALASTTPGASDMSAKQLYETAYSQLLQQDYAQAEAGFDEFLKRFPGDQLAGNAQYWLGETYFVRGQYKPAAGAFLKGYQTYAKSTKAPDSLLKLAMSLERLGQKDAACSTFGELNTRFPNAPVHVKNRVQTERTRVGCPA